MGFISSMFSAGQGAGFQSQGANIQNPTNPYDLQYAQNGAQFSGDLYRNAAANYANVNPAALQQQVFNQQQGLTNQFQNIANGQGPNPAQAMLNQQTGANIASQASLMGGQRGVNQNVGLASRQIAQQGAATQQQAVGQGATMQAQQQLAALQALQQQQTAMGNTAGQISAAQNATIGGAGNLSAQNQAALLSAQNAYNAQQVAMRGNMNSTNANVAGVNAQGQWGLVGGLGSGAGSALAGSVAGLAKGGEVKDTHHAMSYLMGHMMKSKGGHIPGKAQVKGDSYSNDTVPAMLSPGEIVVPRSKAKDPEKAAAFAKAIAMRSRK